ncbi:hypothetical protein L288_14415 [Sphingobium quisquiliarum P25]|uniref:Pyridine nucleotide-disulfide oxidoreductase domain-containing protein 2 n=1 Tax=Sphingobium quisquiliarum P25 TaxID=1329909 RepID=T0I3R0_9SPHN|nr:NAD(P)/FAD-dependent oxidoreductase [Sphingobium quisquiliarum]EQB04269.1 hypothetical protein L288_14415 [Sphingobium quisquiliarum P25]
MTIERGHPGFTHDLHSVHHYLIQPNPLIRNDELNLLSKFGLEYVHPGAFQTTILSDFSTLEVFDDLDRTCQSIARHSEKDAEAYRDLAMLGARVLPMLMAGMYTVPLPLHVTLGMLSGNEDGRRIIDMMFRSPLQVVDELFESDHIKIHMIRSATEHTLGFPDDMGNGLCVLLTTALQHNFKTGMPIGGSGALAAALARCIEYHGGTIIKNAKVEKVLTSGGRATGLLTTDGDEYAARDAVVASIHPRNLDKFVDGIPDTVVARGKRTIQSPYGIIKIDGGLKEPLKKNMPSHISEDSIVKWIFADNLRDFLKAFDPMRHGEINYDRPLLAGSDMQIPGRSPEDNPLLYLLQHVPYKLADGGAQKWDEIKERVADNMIEKAAYFMPNLTPDNILFRLVDSPLDMERHSPNSMVDGDACGLGFHLFQFGGMRPTPELSNYAVPNVEGLYLSGPFMHPGGGVFSIGRPVAIKMFDDMGIDFDKVVAQ